MDQEYEKILVKSFFTKRIQNRVLYELASPKKRKHVISRLSNYQDYLETEYFIEIPKPNSYYIETLDLLKKYGAGDFCYAISNHHELDGRHLKLQEALEKAIGNGMPSLISCIPNKLAYFEGEQMYGSPDRFIILK